MCGPTSSRADGPSGPTRRQLLLAGAAAPLLPRLPRRAPAVALGSAEVQPRSAWGADLGPRGRLSEEAPQDVRFLLVHHTASSNGYAQSEVPGILRGFYGFHTTQKGWPDLAYNFMVDRFGRVWEGRTGSLGGPVKGDATGGSQGFALLACFIGDHTSEPPSAAALDAMGAVLGALALRHQIDVRPGSKATFVSRGSNLHPAGTSVTTATIAGHRNMSRTSCPGDACYRLLPSRLVPAAVAAAGLAAPPPAAPSSTAAVPSAAPPVPSIAPATVPAIPPGETVPQESLSQLPLDPAPPPTVSPAPPGLLDRVSRTAERRREPVAAGAAAGALLTVAGMAALVLRRRGNREATPREDPHHPDEPD